MQSADSLIDKRSNRNVQSNLKTENYFYLIDEVSIKVLLLLSLLLHVHYLLNVYVLIKVFKECARFVLLLPPQSLIGRLHDRDLSCCRTQHYTEDEWNFKKPKFKRLTEYLSILSRLYFRLQQNGFPLISLFLKKMDLHFFADQLT